MNDTVFKKIRKIWFLITFEFILNNKLIVAQKKETNKQIKKTNKQNKTNKKNKQTKKHSNKTDACIDNHFLKYLKKFAQFHPLQNMGTAK